jgi:hypothetical protein
MPVSIATLAPATALARGPITTPGTVPSGSSPNPAAVPATSTASAPPARSRSSAERAGRYRGLPSCRLTRIGYPVCHVSAASAPGRLPPARSPTTIARVGPLRICASASRLSARRSSRGFFPGSAS